MDNNDELKWWSDLDDDERAFLKAWHSATPEQRADALAVMLNHQRHKGDGQVIPFPTAPRGDE